MTAAQTEIVPVRGMHCGGCERTVSRAVEDVPGVGSARADFVAEEVEVTFDPENEGTRVTLRHFKLENLGTNATAVRDAVGSDQGWPTLLALMKGFAESR